MIDLHDHLLPGLDDGPAEMPETIEMARAAVAAGTTAMAVTPHVNDRYPTTPQAMLTALEATTSALAGAGVALELRPGAEIAYERVEQMSDADLRAFSLGGSARYILIECPFTSLPMSLELTTGRLAQLGLRTLFAHPERCAGVQSDEGFDRLAEAVDRGLMIQVNSTSITGGDAKRSGAAARRLLKAGLVHVVASDAHDPVSRPPRLDGVASAIGDAELAQWLTVDLPAAILAGESPPERPQTGGAKRGLLMRLRGRG